MRIFADLHIHSKYSRATSPAINIENLALNAKKKGLNLLGTGDFTHPLWLEELVGALSDKEGVGLFKPTRNLDSNIHFILTAEVCTNFEFEGKSKRIHHLLLAPSLDHVAQINDRLARFGDLMQDGRPILSMSAAELVEELTDISRMNEVIPAHVWTPWFSLFGAVSGFDSVNDCYEEASDKIHALETGLSSDPPMNWRLSKLDRYVLVSNSDSHSPWPWRLGREANLFEMEEPTYELLINSIRTKNRAVLKGTIEVNPAYGKYHWTGHRKCAFSVPPEKAVALNCICPVCHRKLTKGVDQRVLELSDRPHGFTPKGSIPYRHLLPLSEIIAAVAGSSSLYNRSVQRIHTLLVENLGNEFEILLSSSKEDIAELVDPVLADAILKVRHGEMEVAPGYDGVYGRIVFSKKNENSKKRRDFSDGVNMGTSKNDFNGKLDSYL
ncbi:DNA helicase UvrD [Candidatus Bathyarchaeota archaeon]|nr:DNA helicase UvrD [Candidatus Bathyarchaeota archaeon]